MASLLSIFCGSAVTTLKGSLLSESFLLFTQLAGLECHTVLSKTDESEDSSSLATDSGMLPAVT